LKLISLAGGFTDIADEDSIIIQRKTAKGETKIERVSFDDIRDGRIADVLLQAGDYIEVRRSVI
ncbi:MAG: sugar ABC transporter substrate-binding protein, partial [Myxococcales bacterium]|nr:sugar ABC transporter substrate-binding protein [Myxococcales bacterium]